MVSYLFVSGVQRSGTTALGQLLNAHPKIALGIERYKYVYARRFETVSPELFEEARFFDRRPEDTNISAGAEYRALRRKFRAVRFVGDKMPGLYRKFDALVPVFAGLTMVYIYRRPDFVAASWQARAENADDAWDRRNDYRAAVQHWNAGMAMAADLYRRHPRAFIPVEYESLFSGDDARLSAFLARIGAGAAAELSAAYAAMTAGWKDRASTPRLTRDQAAFVSGSADWTRLADLKPLAEDV